MGVWPQFRSALVWDVFAVSTYACVSFLFWFVGLIPDPGDAARTARKSPFGRCRVWNAGDGLARLGRALLAALPDGVPTAGRSGDAVRRIGAFNHGHGISPLRFDCFQHKQPFLNVHVLRVPHCRYFSVWLVWSWLVRRAERQLRENPGLDSVDRVQFLSGIGLLLYCLTLTSASIDWCMYACYLSNVAVQWAISSAVIRPVGGKRASVWSPALNNREDDREARQGPTANRWITPVQPREERLNLRWPFCRRRSLSVTVAIAAGQCVG